MPEAQVSRSPVKASLWAAGLFFVAVLLIFHETAWSMIAIWSRSETYAHGFLILPISMWMVWIRRDQLWVIKPMSALWVALLIIPPGFVWLLAWLVDVLVVQQLALVAMLVVGVWVILGHQLARTLIFPLLFLFFAVPMGEALVTPMMEFTATSTVWMIQQTGIPVYREGLYFTLPSGNWSVVEACSGVRYIIASVTLGVLYAYLTFQSLWRRAVFVLVSAIVPVVANSVRAYIIVMLGHMSDMTIATGVDHLIYGWVFFGIVVFLLFWVGSFWREDGDFSIEEKVTTTTSSTIGTTASLALATTMAIFLAGFWSLFSMLIEPAQIGDKDARLQAPPAVAGWARESRLQWDWRPIEAGADAELLAFYRRGEQHIALYLQQYLQQEQGAEVVSGKVGQFVNAKQSWRISELGAVNALLGANSIQVDQLELRRGGRQLLLWSWYRIGTHYTSNPYMAKWYEAIQAITFGRQDSARIILATTVAPYGNQEEVLQSFISAYLPAIEAALDTTALRSR